MWTHPSFITYWLLQAKWFDLYYIFHLSTRSLDRSRNRKHKISLFLQDLPPYRNYVNRRFRYWDVFIVEPVKSGYWFVGFPCFHLFRLFFTIICFIYGLEQPTTISYSVWYCYCFWYGYNIEYQALFIYPLKYFMLLYIMFKIRFIFVVKVYKINIKMLYFSKFPRQS